MRSITIGTMAIALIMTVFISREARAVDLTHSFVVGADVGFYLDPDMVGWDVLGEYQVTGNVAVGPLLSFGADNDRFLFGASGFAKYKANLSESPKLKPYGFIGIGFLRTYEDVAHEDDREITTDFLIPVGGGFEYWQTDRFAWGSNVVFNISDDIFFGLMFGVRTRF